MAAAGAGVGVAVQYAAVGEQLERKFGPRTAFDGSSIYRICGRRRFPGRTRSAWCIRRNRCSWRNPTMVAQSKAHILLDNKWLIHG